jgi:hypothetical protein
MTLSRAFVAVKTAERKQVPAAAHDDPTDYGFVGNLAIPSEWSAIRKLGIPTRTAVPCVTSRSSALPVRIEFKLLLSLLLNLRAIL